MKKLYSFIVAVLGLAAFSASAQDYSTIESMCAKYRWETWGYAGEDIAFNVSIKKDKTENGVVINGVFDKYELKGTFDAATGAVVVENQRVGFDADKGQFLSFVHVDYSDDVDPEALILDNSQDGDLYTYECYAVVCESMDGEYILDEGFVEYGQFGFLYRTGENQITEWEEAGVATLFDGGFFTPLPRFGIGMKTPVEVVLEKSKERDNVYRLVNPWSSYFGKEIESYLEFDISDSNCVIIPTQSTGVTDEEYGLASVQNFVGMYIASGLGVDDAMEAIPTGKENQYLCTYNDAKKVVTMPVNSTFTTFAKDENFWNVGTAYGAADSYIVMPGTTGVDEFVTDVNEAPAEYYNLQGIRVDNPAEGQVVIRRQGSTITKMVK